MIRHILVMLYRYLWAPDFWIIPKCDLQLDRTQLNSSLKVNYKSIFQKSMIVLMTGVLLIKAPTHDNHRLLSYHDNGFCDMIIILAILLHITTGENAIRCIFRYTDVSVMPY